jgi:SAM-dependent methyltransferase
MDMDGKLAALLACPDCRGSLSWGSEQGRCGSCGALFEVVDGVPMLLPSGGRTPKRDEKQRQAVYFDEAVSDDFEISRPHHTPAFHGWLLTEKLRRSISDLPAITTESTALVVCSGSAMDAEFLCRAGCQVIACDISLGAARRARARAERFGLDILPVVGDAEQLPLGDRSVDLTFVHDGLHHLSAPAIALSEMARVAGRSVSVNEPARARATEAAIRLGIALEVEEAGNPVIRFRPDEIGAELERGGLHVRFAGRYAMYYRHEPGPATRFLSRRRLLPLARWLFGAVAPFLSPAGNKLTVQAVRASDTPFDARRSDG